MGFDTIEININILVSIICFRVTFSAYNILNSSTFYPILIQTAGAGIPANYGII